MHKGIETDPWGDVWSVAFILIMGFALGLMAEGLYRHARMEDSKIKHYEGAH